MSTELLDAIRRLLEIEKAIRNELRLATEDDVDWPYSEQPLDAWDSVEISAELAIRKATGEL